MATTTTPILNGIAESHPLPPARDIPSSIMTSIKSWWAAGEKAGAASEERILRLLPFFESPTWPRQSTELPVVGRSSRVELDSPKKYLNVFSITPTNAASPAAPPTVLLHGYGAGLGFFFRNFPMFGRWAARTGAPVYAMDWLGMGRSARVPFTVRAPRDDTQARVSQAEAFFIDALEQWRERAGLSRMTLVGHSLGAYLSVAYALRYPERVSKLILLSPAGMLGAPEADQLSREFTEDQSEVMTDNRSGSSTTLPSESLTTGSTESEASTTFGRAMSAQSETSRRIKDLKKELEEKKGKETLTRRMFRYMWEEGWSPFQVVRNLSVFGPMLIGKYSSRRFSSLDAEETKNLNEYILNITLAKGSGEYCITHILAPFAHARMPLVDRITNLNIPVIFVYGQHDWMDPAGGLISVQRLQAQGKDARMYIIPEAGHHLYCDNPTATDDLLDEELSNIPLE